MCGRAEHTPHASHCAGGHPVGASGLKVCMRGEHSSKGVVNLRGSVYPWEG